MKNNIEKFLEFNGKRISVLLADGTWWVAIKPICEALSVDFEKQRERISRHPILSQLPTKQGVVAIKLDALKCFVCQKNMSTAGCFRSTQILLN